LYSGLSASHLTPPYMYDHRTHHNRSPGGVVVVGRRAESGLINAQARPPSMYHRPPT
jgi:hypothetical protein